MLLFYAIYIYVCFINLNKHDISQPSKVLFISGEPLSPSSHFQVRGSSLDVQALVRAMSYHLPTVSSSSSVAAVAGQDTVWVDCQMMRFNTSSMTWQQQTAQVRQLIVLVVLVCSSKMLTLLLFVVVCVCCYYYYYYYGGGGGGCVAVG